MLKFWRGALAACCMLLLAGGCASSPDSTTAPVAQDDPASVAQRYIDALRASNAEQLAATLSSAFSHPEYGDKAEFAAMMQQFTGIRYFEGMTADTANLPVQSDGAAATAGPVALHGSFGAMTLSFRLAKEEQAWRITAVDFAGQ